VFKRIQRDRYVGASIALYVVSRDVAKAIDKGRKGNFASANVNGRDRDGQTKRIRNFNRFSQTGSVRLNASVRPFWREGTEHVVYHRGGSR
jgi:hypothetical protein